MSSGGGQWEGANRLIPSGKSVKHTSQGDSILTRLENCFCG